MKRCVLTILIMLTCLFVLPAARAEGTITLPTSLDSIEAGAFMGDTSLGRVIVPEGTTRIESKAFANSSVTEITLPGSIFLALVAIMPGLAMKFLGIQQQFAYFYGGTSLLIMVGVVLDTLKQIESYLLMRHYDGLMKTGRIQGR